MIIKITYSFFNAQERTSACAEIIESVQTGGNLPETVRSLSDKRIREGNGDEWNKTYCKGNSSCICTCAGITGVWSGSKGGKATVTAKVKIKGKTYTLKRRNYDRNLFDKNT